MDRLRGTCSVPLTFLCYSKINLSFFNFSQRLPSVPRQKHDEKKKRQQKGILRKRAGLKPSKSAADIELCLAAEGIYPCAYSINSIISCPQWICGDSAGRDALSISLSLSLTLGWCSPPFWQRFLWTRQAHPAAVSRFPLLWCGCFWSLCFNSERVTNWPTLPLNCKKNLLILHCY